MIESCIQAIQITNGNIAVIYEGLAQFTVMLQPQFRS